MKIVAVLCCVAGAAVCSAAVARPGACCLPSGVCFVTTQAICEAHGGTYAGDNVTCAGANCPRPATGACCLQGGFCIVVPQAFCTAAGGTYAGDNVACADANCVPSCDCDWNHDGAVNTSDFFDFLHDFFDGNADFNGDGHTDTRDFFDFIRCFFACR